MSGCIERGTVKHLIGEYGRQDMEGTTYEGSGDWRRG
jgi:hypothetical protein